MHVPSTTPRWLTHGAVWRELDKPILAMIRGYCIGGGLLVAMRADIRIAAEGSQFAVPAARLGLGYAFGGVEELVALVGPSWAAEILFSARRLSADEALRIGLVNRVVPVDELEAQVRELAHDHRRERSAHRVGVQGRDPRGIACRRRIATEHWSTSSSKRASAPTTISKGKPRFARSASRAFAVSSSASRS